MCSVSRISGGRNGQPKFLMESADQQQTCEVYLYGATVTSWRQNGVEKLFCSPTTPFDGVAAIRGGIPLVFPQFGRPSETMPQHGFARTSNWEVARIDSNADSCTVELTLKDNEQTLALWPHPFALQYTLTLNASGLRTTFRAANTGSSPFQCQALLHTYIAVPHIQNVSVSGFEGLAFHDKMDPPAGDYPLETRTFATIDREVDRIYLDPATTTDCEGDEFALKTVRVVDQRPDESSEVLLSVDRKAYVKSEHEVKSLATDCVLWNAWVDKCKAIGDLEDDAYLRYVCVEPGVCSRFETVAPNETLVLDQFLS